MVEGFGTGFCSDVEENADVGVQGTTESVEEPTVRVQLLRVGFLQAEDHLAWHNALFSALELQVGIQ